MDLNNGDKAYCIFDTDTDPNKNKIINEAIKLANKKGIQIITSTPCFELWFYLHFAYVIKKLKKYYPKYEKNINIFPNINDKVNITIENAKKLEKYQINLNRAINSTEANPNTEVYKIVRV